MKKLIINILFIVVPMFINAQSINWESTSAQGKHMAYINFGYDFGMASQLGYAYQLKTKRPLWLSIDYSIPMGGTITDDYKTRIGGQMALVEKNNFVLTTSVHAIAKRYENDLVRMNSFGTSIAGTIGYYKTKWHVAATVGFDKSVSTHLKHTERMKDNYSSIQDGWYAPTGGHWFYGIQASRRLGKTFFLSLDLGATNAEGKDVDALLPVYFQLGLIKRF